MSMNTNITLRQAGVADWGAVQALLEAHQLPTAGAREHLSTYVLAVGNGEVVGCAGAEVYGDIALLRSVAVIGAGPVGLAAAARLIERGIEPLVLEAGARVGANLLDCGHVRLFSPWRYDVDAAMAAQLAATGWSAPPADEVPLAREVVERVLQPYAELPAVARALHLSTRVTAISREGFDKVKSAGREAAPFVIRALRAGQAVELRARAVIDASGTWTQPNPLSASGLPALGEREHAGAIFYGIPDVLGRDRARYAGRRTLVVGTGPDGQPLALQGIDQIVCATGQRPDLAMVGELRLKLDPGLASTEALGPLIDPNAHCCGTVRPHAHRELAHPESGFYTLGVKSYGRAPTFLMATGFEQARSVVAAIAGACCALDEQKKAQGEAGCGCSTAAPAAAVPVAAACASGCGAPRAPKASAGCCG